MNKNDLISAVSEQAGITKADASKAVARMPLYKKSHKGRAAYRAEADTRKRRRESEHELTTLLQADITEDVTKAVRSACEATATPMPRFKAHLIEVREKVRDTMRDTMRATEELAARTKEKVTTMRRTKSASV